MPVSATMPKGPDGKPWSGTAPAPGKAIATVMDIGLGVGEGEARSDSASAVAGNFTKTKRKRSQAGMVKQSKTVATDTLASRRVGSCNEQRTEPGHRLSPLCFGHRFPTPLGFHNPLLKTLRLTPQVLAASLVMTLAWGGRVEARWCTGLTVTSPATCTVLYLGNKGLNSISNSQIRKFSNLQEIDLWGNNLSSVPPDLFRGLSNLHTIWLSSNNLSSVPPDLFGGLSNLREIGLGGNNLSSVPPDLFGGLSNLRSIRLNSNNLSSVPPDLFRGLSNLQTIDLQSNNLSSVPPDLFERLSNLQEILLGNSLSILPPDLFGGLSSLRRVYIHDLTCPPPSLPTGAYYLANPKKYTRIICDDCREYRHCVTTDGVIR